MVSSPSDGGQSMKTKSNRSSPAVSTGSVLIRGSACIALCSRCSRATTLTSSISAPARSMVAGTTNRFSTSGQVVITSARGRPSTSRS